MTRKMNATSLTPEDARQSVALRHTVLQCLYPSVSSLVCRRVELTIKLTFCCCSSSHGFDDDLHYMIQLVGRAVKTAGGQRARRCRHIDMHK